MSFKGIPYAAQPVGDLRWRAPQPAPHWTGTKVDTAFCHDCEQVVIPNFFSKPRAFFGEDCLNLNIWRPSKDSGKKLPVMVWIYGGGFVSGSASAALYDGSAFAQDGIVFVSFDYRLGRLGFFAHPALSAEHPENLQGNYGLMDQVAALQWVRRNIARVGGDPDRVTLFGESAGGISVQTLLVSPVAKGLFQQAIIQSGAGRDNLIPLRDLDKDKPGLASAESVGVDFARHDSIEGRDAAALAALRRLDVTKVLDGLTFFALVAPHSEIRDRFAGAPIIEGKLVAGAPDAAYKKGTEARIPVIIGATNADLGASLATTKDQLFAQFGDRAGEARQLYDPSGVKNFALLKAQVMADVQMVEPARYAAAQIAAHGTTVYEYRFGYVPDSLRGKLPGAIHASDVPFVFETLPVSLGARRSPNDQAMAGIIHTYWVNFVKNGDPNGTGLPPWPRYNTEKDELLNFEAGDVRAIQDPWKQRLDLVEKTAEKMGAQ